MNRTSKNSLAVAVVAAFVAAPANAAQPGHTVNPNGIPGGKFSNPNNIENND